MIGRVGVFPSVVCRTTGLLIAIVLTSCELSGIEKWFVIIRIANSLNL